jgi:hypothetical protein
VDYVKSMVKELALVCFFLQLMSVVQVVELELKLEQVVEDKKKAEKSAEEALLKLLTGQ